MSASKDVLRKRQMNKSNSKKAILVPVDPGKKKGIYTETICLLIITFCHCA